MRTLTAFSWGFWGWGSATRQLVRAVDAVESARGFRPPIFVDIRFRRSGRAAGFRGDAFEKLLGRKRYRWMQSLGNKNFGSSRKVAIAYPKSAYQLLDLVLDASDRGS